MLLVEAAHQRESRPGLVAADAVLNTFQMHLRLCYDHFGNFVGFRVVSPGSICEC
jgi:hypothetical protein